MSDSGIGKGIGIGMGLPCGCLVGIGILFAVLFGGCLAMLGFIGASTPATETTQTPTRPADMAGEEIAREDLPLINGMNFYYYLPNDSPEQLVKVARWYEKENPGSYLISVYFYDSKTYAARELPMTDAQLAHYVAHVEGDIFHGTRTYQRRADGWKEYQYSP